MTATRKAIEKAGRELLKYHNVIGYSNNLQKRIRKGVVVDEDVVRVYVTRKIPVSELKPSEIIPREIDVEGVKLKTDVVEIGRVKKLAGYTQRYRPAPCGVSTSRLDEASAGTIGWYFVDEDGNVYVASNNHVWAKENQGSRGDILIQPGRLDGGNEYDQIAILYDFIPIQWTGVNKVDVAIAQPVDISNVYMSIMELGGITGVVREDPGAIGVKKVGRTTGYTTGSLIDWDATINVEYDNGVALFTDVFLATGSNIAKPGDSGSPVLDDRGRFMGLVFAGNDDASLLVGCKTTNIETELSSRVNKRIYTLVANSSPPFRRETEVQVVYPPVFWTILVSSILMITLISTYETIQSGWD